MTRNARKPILEEEEEEWDLQGINSVAKEDLESFGSDDEETEEEESDVLVIKEEWDEDEENESSEDLNVDGLAELEQMERALVEEESLDFALITEEE